MSIYRPLPESDHGEWLVGDALSTLANGFYEVMAVLGASGGEPVIGQAFLTNTVPPDFTPSASVADRSKWVVAYVPSVARRGKNRKKLATHFLCKVPVGGAHIVAARMLRGDAYKAFRTRIQSALDSGDKS